MKKEKIALDSNLVTFLIDAMKSESKPEGDISDQKLATLRLYLYSDCAFCIPQTVYDECMKITCNAKKIDHEHFMDTIFDDILNQDIPQMNKILCKYKKLLPNKKYKNDRIIISCAEAYKCTCFLTYDIDLLKKLNNTIMAFEPLEFWNTHVLSKDASIKRSPRPSNPLFNENWWQWKL